MMIYTSDRDRIPHFFSGRCELDGTREPGSGIVRLGIPRIRREKSSFSEGADVVSRSIFRFIDRFPYHADNVFELTFKHDSPIFYFRGAPEGTAFIWSHTAIDFDRVTRLPLGSGTASSRRCCKSSGSRRGRAPSLPRDVTASPNAAD